MVKLKIIFLLLIMSSGIAPYSKAQEIKVVSTGQGVTEDEATKTALRSALEDAYGTFISSSTKIENNVLVSDEIVSLTQGNIHKYDVINSIQLVNGLYSVTVESLISLNKLAAYCQNQGMSVSFNGKAFGMELKIREFNRQNEIKILKDLANQIILMPCNLYDFKLQTTEPKQKEGVISIFVLITPHPTSNMASVSKFCESTLKSISLTKDERRLYNKLGIPYHEVHLYSFPNYSYTYKPSAFDKPFYFRDKKAIELLKQVFFGFRNTARYYWTLFDNVKGKVSGIQKDPLPIGVEKRPLKLVPTETGFRVKEKDLNIKIGVPQLSAVRLENELIKLEYTYTPDEITQLETLVIEPNNEIYETIIKPELIDIIAKFDDIE